MNTIKYAGLTFSDKLDGTMEIKNASCHKACALLSDVLEIDSFKAKVLSDIPLIPFARNTPLVWYRDNQPVGTYFVQSVYRSRSDLYEIEATSAIGILEQDTHYGGIYSGETVDEVIQDICTVPYILKTAFQNIKLYGWLPIQSRRDNLSQVLFAIGASVRTDYHGALHIGSLWSEVSGDIPDDRIFLGDKVACSAAVTSISVVEHQYVKTGKEETTLYEGIALDGDVITFSEPMHSLAAVGFAIIESGANYAVLSAGNGILAGVPYAHTTREIKKSIADVEQENAVTVKDATLISPANSVAIAARLANYYASSQIVNHDIVYAGEMPGDVVTLNHPFDQCHTIGCIESVGFNLDRVLRASQRILLDYAPPDITQVEYYDTSEIISTNSTWKVPEGVTSVRAVLIGGGTGGTPGEDGEDGNIPSQRIDRYDAMGADGGAGGKPGVGGTGGKVYVTDINTKSGETFMITIGIGGLENAGIGGNTVLKIGVDEKSSIIGSSSEEGYTDTITGQTFAKKGDVGTSGKAGGQGGPPFNSSELSAGENYDDVYKGGAYGIAGVGYLNQGTAWSLAGGGAGGGAAYRAHGEAGTDGYASMSRRNENTYYAEPGTGGAGATAMAPPPATVFGHGGAAGHGGGGAGGTGCVAWQSRGVNIESPYTFGVAGKGGKGSSGGKGAQGCIILSYRAPKMRQSGALLDKNTAFFLDRYGRKLIV